MANLVKWLLSFQNRRQTWIIPPVPIAIDPHELAFYAAVGWIAVAIMFLHA